MDRKAIEKIESRLNAVHVPEVGWYTRDEIMAAEDQEGTTFTLADATFIAHAPQDIADLLARITELEDEVRRLTASAPPAISPEGECMYRDPRTNYRCGASRFSQFHSFVGRTETYERHHYRDTADETASDAKHRSEATAHYPQDESDLGKQGLSPLCTFPGCGKPEDAVAPYGGDNPRIHLDCDGDECFCKGRRNCLLCHPFQTGREDVDGAPSAAPRGCRTCGGDAVYDADNRGEHPDYDHDFDPTSLAEPSRSDAANPTPVVLVTDEIAKLALDVFVHRDYCEPGYVGMRRALEAAIKASQAKPTTEGSRTNASPSLESLRAELKGRSYIEEKDGGWRVVRYNHVLDALDHYEKHLRGEA